MNALDSITLRAVLVALQQMDSSLPLEVQSQLNVVGEDFPANISRLHLIAKSYAPLAQQYRIARIALQTDHTENLRFTSSQGNSLVEDRNTDFLKFAASVLTAHNSVDEAKRLAMESDVLDELLSQLQQYKNVELRQSYDSTKEPKFTPRIASTSKAMQAYFATLEEWSDVYRRLAQS